MGCKQMYKGFLQTLIFKENSQHRLDITFFGYSDDPIVCNDGPEVSANICTDFKDSVHGDVEYASLYVPILKKNGRSRSWLSTSCPYSRNCL